MANYAIVENGKVINSCAWDGVTPWQPPEGTQAIEIPEGVVAGVGYFYINGKFVAPPPPVITPADNAVTANQILSDTDWTSIPAVGNPNQSNPYLANQSAWLYYRSQIRDIALDPPVGEVNWPTPPQEVWQES